MKLATTTFIIFSLTHLLGCSIYRSADRAKFESDAPSLLIQTLQKNYCTQQSLAEYSSHSQFIAPLQNEFLWKHVINDKIYYESTDLKGNFCIYEVKHNEVEQH